MTRTFATVYELQAFVGMLDPQQPVTFTVWSNTLYPEPQLVVEGVEYETGRGFVKSLPVVDRQERVVVRG
jgi:hypothetical protein